ncbi:LacI family DNA-binding transcriptional regulator [Streptomyces sp. SL13]|uniref:LacI family DNA-binding transcriptional regulator n=1 Tax=Streptantibioticus silvisoli TaxID=2705255 RepID=A0AA90H1A5_9ACTN|nr:LacI family DNA-binding transcriptional regulator [Streptantibioticus silvisoli]MDI5969173.1 LacI family DNA-binding transcriptional regulator [Streptantibioticus silvisoli]
MGARIGLKDVAAMAGVSFKTVSNVVRGEGRVSAATRERVLAAVAELGYRPNHSARQLRTGRSGIVMLAVPELLSPYFAELAAAFIAAAKERPCTVLIEETQGDPEEELRLAAGMVSPLIDGVVLSPLRLDRERLAAREGDFPLVLLGEREYDVAADHVGIDNVAAAREAVRHLLAAGRRRIGVLGRQDDPLFATGATRMRGYREALDAAGVAFDPALAPAVPWYSRDCGAAGMRELLALPEPPDAVFCFADVLASGALRAAHEAGVRVPRDVALVGFDDVEESRFSVPSLSSVRPDRAGIAGLALDAVLERISAGGKRLEQRVLTASHGLRVRESSGS